MMKKGFTLAEVLITLGIIGIVSALTLPNLVGNYQEKVLITQLQKNYNMIRSTVPNAMQKEGVTRTTELVTNDAQKNVEFLRNFFEVTTVCTKASGFDKCLASSYQNLKGESVPVEELMEKSLYTNSYIACGNVSTGAAICVSPRMEWLVDVNGKDKPNKIGRDIFWFMLDRNGAPELSLAYSDRGSSTYDASDAARANQELNGELCKSTNNTKSVRASSCLPYVISRGWKF